MSETANSIEEILAQAENPAFVRTATARVLLRQDLLNRHADLDAELTAAVTKDASHNQDPTAPAIAEQLAELEAEIEAAKVEFRFKSVGKRAWADLLAAHPPTKEQLKRDGRLDHNPDTFPVAAIAASCVEPPMTLDHVARLEAALGSTQFDLLWARCIDANIGGLDAPKSLAAGVILRVNGRSESTPVPAASLAASSSDDE